MSKVPIEAVILAIYLRDKDSTVKSIAKELEITEKKVKETLEEYIEDLDIDYEEVSEP